MKKNNAFVTLLKDAAMGGIGYVVGIILAASLFHATGEAIFSIAMYFACIPFGWRWASRVVAAVSFKGLLLKLVISLFLGIVAIVLVLGKDILACAGSLMALLFKGGAKAVKARTASR